MVQIPRRMNMGESSMRDLYKDESKMTFVQSFGRDTRVDFSEEVKDRAEKLCALGIKVFDQKNSDLCNGIPSEIKEIIVSNLDYKSKVNLARSCKSQFFELMNVQEIAHNIKSFPLAYQKWEEKVDKILDPFMPLKENVARLSNELKEALEQVKRLSISFKEYGIFLMSYSPADLAKSPIEDLLCKVISVEEKCNELIRIDRETAVHNFALSVFTRMNLEIAKAA